jgi:hypothetical protein
MPWGHDGLKDERCPQFCLRSGSLHSAKIGTPTRRRWRSRSAILDPATPPCPRASSFTNFKETTTMVLEQHIEELRREMNATYDRVERREIEAELELACAELEVIMAEQEGVIDAEPPF